jgi:hypothetical protein
MSQTQLAEAATISEPLTWKQICERYPDEWVCLVEIDSVNDTDFEFRTARVIGHGKTRREPLEQARPLRAQYEEIGHYFTGRVRAPVPRIFL